MKTSLSLLLSAALCASTAQAELFRSGAATGAVIGGAAGAIIGNNSGSHRNNGLKGAAIGSVAGALVGSAVADSRHSSRSHGSSYYSRGGSRYGRHDGGARISIGYGYGHGRPYWNPVHRHSVFARPGHIFAYPGYRYGSYWRPYGYDSYYYGAPLYSSYGYGYAGDGYYGAPSGAATGAILGGLAGAIIGNNSGNGSGWQGAAIGAGTGLILGAVSDSARERREARVPVSQAPYVEAPQADLAAKAAAEAPRNVTIINNYYGGSSPMSGANSLYGR
jgi:outer membrane lipoprotein SlyB